MGCTQMAQLGEQDSVQGEKWGVSPFFHPKILPPAWGNSTSWLDESEKKKEGKKKKFSPFSVHLICEKSTFSHGLHLICNLKPNGPLLMLHQDFSKGRPSLALAPDTVSTWNASMEIWIQASNQQRWEMKHHGACLEFEVPNIILLQKNS